MVEPSFPKQIPTIRTMTFGKIEIVIHEVTEIVNVFGQRVFRIAYHITDNERLDAYGKPIKTPVAWLFVAEPTLTEEEKRGKTATQLAELWVKKWTENLRNNLKSAIEIYRANREVFIR